MILNGSGNGSGNGHRQTLGKILVLCRDCNHGASRTDVIKLKYSHDMQKVNLNTCCMEKKRKKKPQPIRIVANGQLNADILSAESVASLLDRAKDSLQPKTAVWVYFDGYPYEITKETSAVSLVNHVNLRRRLRQQAGVY